MKRIVSVMFILTAFAFLAAVGCKTRDVKKQALALGPQTNPCNLKSFVGGITPSLFCTEILGTTIGKAPSFNYCYSGEHQVIYSFTLVNDGNNYYPDETRKGYSSFDVEYGFQIWNRDAGYYYKSASDVATTNYSDKYVTYELRRNCNLSDPSAIISCGSGWNQTGYGGYLPVGTYYLAISSFENGGDDAWNSELNYGVEFYNYSSYCGEGKGPAVKAKIEAVMAQTTPGPVTK